MMMVWPLQVYGADVLFAGYFDIQTNQQAGELVFGKINLKRNKDAHAHPIPQTYQFVVKGENNTPFELRTEFDDMSRVFGVFYVKNGQKTPAQPQVFSLDIVLLDGRKTLAEQTVHIEVVQETLWHKFQAYFEPVALDNSRLWGRRRFTDRELVSVMDALEENEGRVPGSLMYQKDAYQNYDTDQHYRKSDLRLMDPEKTKRLTLESDWQDVVTTIGALGRSYALSEKYGKNSGNGERLKKVLYQAIIQYAHHIPILPQDVSVNGKPLGTELGDGFALLTEHRIVTHGLATHQWEVTDAMIFPMVKLMPDLLADIDAGDPLAKACHEAAMRVFQVAFSIVKSRRVMDSFDQRWKAIADSRVSQGAWADANIGHRIRTFYALPIIFADYNRPMTYVPYWYEGYFDGTEYEGQTFAKNWSPHGVLFDMHHWSNMLSVPSRTFFQSGFHPDGTVSHHLGHGSSDVAMNAYGYGWMMNAKEATGFFKDTRFPLKDEVYQFVVDRVNWVYSKMIFKGQLDFIVTGRSFFADYKRYARTLHRDVNTLIDNKDTASLIKDEEAVLKLVNDIREGRNKSSSTTAFWIADYLVHRREDADGGFFFSVKNKSVRTAGAEDFTRVRKSWHLGSGVLQLRVTGQEYNQNVLAHWDFHAVPGVTEEWRRDVFPQKGGASIAMPGGNLLSGQLSDGEYGMSYYHHKPIPDYNSAVAQKSYFLYGRFATAFGDGIKRTRQGDGQAIVTTIDQSKMEEPIHFSIAGKTGTFEQGEHHDKQIELKAPSWLYHNHKGYLIVPFPEQHLLVKSGDKINVTDLERKGQRGAFPLIETFALALDHGVKPEQGQKDAYHYVLVANAELSEMDDLLRKYLAEVDVASEQGRYHMFHSKTEKLTQISALEPGEIRLADKRTVSVSVSALVMFAEKDDHYMVTVSDPSHDIALKQLTVDLPIA
ncbi:MAG: hypothetical protein HOE48_25450, partial [Candidatus Latescibacteria bacterium]|nr:hypothetical protein [Candidatus Latescibacterota bacterium]